MAQAQAWPWDAAKDHRIRAASEALAAKTSLARVTESRDSDHTPVTRHGSTARR